MRAFALALLLCATTAHAQEECAECEDVPPAPAPAPPPQTMYVAPDGQALPTPTSPPIKYGRHDVLVRAAIGGAYRRALDRDFGGGTFDFEIGWDGRYVSVGSRIGLESGATQSHLAYQHLTWGFGVDGKIGDRVRLGVAPYVGLLVISRATTGDGTEALLGATFSLLGECIVAILGPGQPSTRTHPGLDLIVRGGYELVDTVPRSSTLANGASVQLALGVHY